MVIPKIETELLELKNKLINQSIFRFKLLIFLFLSKFVTKNYFERIGNFFEQTLPKVLGHYLLVTTLISFPLNN